MEDRFLLNRASAGRLRLLLILGIGFGVAGVVYGVSIPAALPVASLLAGIGAIILVAAIVIYLRERRDECALQIGSDSFTLFRPGSDPLSIADRDVAAIAVRSSEQFSNGRYTGLRRTVRLWVEPEGIDGEPIEFRSFCPADGADRLWPLLDRLVTRLTERASAEIAAGRTAAGALWAMNAQQLTVLDPNRGEVIIPIDDLIAADEVGQIIRIWRRDEEEVAAEIPLDSRNACVLLRLIERVFADKPALPASSDESLGQLLYERRGGGLLPKCALVLAVLSLGATGTFVFAAAARGRVEVSIFAAPLGVIGVIALLAWRRSARGVVRFCLRGAYKKGMFSERKLRYSEIDRIAYFEEKLYMHGFYHGTSVRITIQAADKTKGKISHSAFFHKQTATELEKLRRVRDLISETIAGRMLKRLDEEGMPIDWCSKITILQNGVETVRQKWFSKPEAVFVQFDEIDGFEIEHGFFYLYAFGNKKPLVQVLTGEYNFYPGLSLFSMLLAERQAKDNLHLSR